MQNSAVRLLLLLLLVASSALPQDMRLVAAACGPESVTFDVELNKTLALPKPEPGKALVYVIQDQFYFAGCLKCPKTTRVGVDGAWMGANHAPSWVSFSVPPGPHHLCVDLQAAKVFRATEPGRISLASLAAQAGATYYFRVRLLYGEGGPPLIDLTPIDRDEGQFLLSSYYPSASKPKK